MMQQESWLGIQMMNESRRKDLMRESNQRRLCNRCKKNPIASDNGMISALFSSIAALFFSSPKIRRGIQSR